MSLVSIIGPRPNLFDLEGTSKTKRLEVRQPILTDKDLEKIRSIGDVEDNPFKSCTLDTTFAAEQGAAGLEPALKQLEGGRREGGARWHTTSSSCPTARSAPSACRSRLARLRGRASSPDPRGPAHLGRARGRVGRAARGASLRLPRRLRRRGDQSLSRFRNPDRDEGDAAAEARREGNRQALHQVGRQGHA